MCRGSAPFFLWRQQDLAEPGAVPQQLTESKRNGSRRSENQGGDARKQESIAPEIRPSKNPGGSLKPFYLKRAFK